MRRSILICVISLQVGISGTAANKKVYLQTQHCTEGQGYLFSRPVAAAQFADLLQMSIKETIVH